MTPNEIQEKVQRYLNRDTVADEQIMDAIEEAINWLSRMGFLIDTIEKEYEGKDFYELPEDLIAIFKVEDVEEETYLRDYKIDGNLIRFAEDGKYRLFAERQPKVPESMNDELEMHDSLQYAVLDYVKGFCKVSIDDTSQDGHRLMQKFQQDALKAYQFLKRGQNTPTSWAVRRRARGR